jgi:uncharacterized membrane protein
VAQKLQLEYTVTAAEMDEAQSLGLRKQIGGGSKWRTWVILLALLTGLLVGFYYQIRHDVPAAYQPYVFAAIFIFAFAFVLWKRRGRGRHTVPNRVEISEEEVRLAVGDVKIAWPWAALSDCVESPALFVLIDRPKAVLMVLPKRVFPSESWQTWFRNLANNRPKPSEQALSPRAPLASSGERIVLRFRLGFRDYLDRAAASWFTWGMILGFAGMILGISIYEGQHPPPRAVYSVTQVYFMFMLPATVVMAVMVIFIAAAHPWFSHTKHLIPQEMALSEESIGMASADGTSEVPWTTYTRYKETRWSFILWKGRGGVWMMLPKRAFACADDIDRCRDLLGRHLRRSRWFFG